MERTPAIVGGGAYPMHLAVGSPHPNHRLCVTSSSYSPQWPSPSPPQVVVRHLRPPPPAGLLAESPRPPRRPATALRRRRAADELQPPLGRNPMPASSRATT